MADSPVLFDRHKEALDNAKEAEITTTSSHLEEHGSGEFKRHGNQLSRSLFCHRVCAVLLLLQMIVMIPGIHCVSFFVVSFCVVVISITLCVVFVLIVVAFVVVVASFYCLSL